MTEERWLPIKGYEGIYEVSDQGRVRGLDRIDNCGKRVNGRVMALGLDGRGYLQVRLCKYGVPITKRVHKLIATAFLGESNGLQVNHKNGIKKDNRLSNLEYVTGSENQIHAFKNGLNKNIKPVLQFSKDGEFINEFESIKAAGIKTRVNRCNISSCCVGKLKSAGGFICRS